VLGAVVLVAIVLFGGGSGYEVRAVFQNAGQLVKGNPVVVGGVPAGSVEEISITDDGRAEIRFSVEERYAPLPQGTQAEIRQASQSGIANRYIELRLPSAGRLGVHDEQQVERGRGTIGDGGMIGVDETQTTVDIDQLFNTLDRPTRKALQDFLKGSARQYEGRGRDANRAFLYLNPSLAQTSRLFNELNRDEPTLNRFLVDSAQLVTVLAERRDQLTELVSNLNDTTRALGDEKVALASAIGQLPDFMRRSNTTFVNLRAALDDVDPLVDASRDVVPKLRPFLAELRPFARDARPTVRDLSRIVRRSGGGNDLTELMGTFRPLADIAVDTAERSVDFGTGQRDVGRTPGAFQETADASEAATPILAFGRPYTPDLFGWFDDFSNTGAYDAIGGFSRGNIIFNVTSPNFPAGIPLDQQANEYLRLVKRGQYRRCPGAAEIATPDGSNVWSEEEQEELDCDESHRAPTR
jgi:phospholipid/cholesterol/gamma-HCH transport system substrate-binding protein